MALSKKRSPKVFGSLTTTVGQKASAGGKSVSLMGAAALGSKYHSKVKANRKVGVKRSYRKKP